MSAKKKTSSKTEPAIETEVKKDFSSIIALSISGVFFLLGIFGIAHHEMWRDELQSWMVATDAHSLLQLYKNCVYEGHPLLWYTLLFIINIFTNSPFSMQLLNLLIGTSFVYLFAKHAKFNLLQTLLFVFGYYTLFEYTLIARPYNLELLLMAVFIILYKHPQKYILTIFTILFLLANTSAFGLLFSICFAALFYFEQFISKNKRADSTIPVKKIVSGSVLFFVGIIFSIIQIKPEQGNLVSTDISSLFDIDKLATIFSRIYNAFFILPDLSLLPHWNFSGTMRLDSQNIPLYFIFSVIILILTSLTFYRKPILLIFYLLLTIGIIAICDLTFLLSIRYVGRVFIAFIITTWLANYFPSNQFNNPVNNLLANTGKKIQPLFISIVLLFQLIAGAMYFYNDYKLPFSGSTETADFIKQQKLDTLPVIGSQDYAVSPLSSLLYKKIFYPESQSYGSFIIWDNHLRKHQNPDFDIVFSSVDSVMGKQHKQAILILNALPSGPEGKLEHAFITPTIKLDLIHQSENSMVADEYYYVYLATKVNALN